MTVDVESRKIKYSGNLMSMRRLMFCLREEGLEVEIERSEERRDVAALIWAILNVAGGVAGGVDLVGRIASAIKKYREMNPDGDDRIEVEGEPDDGGFLPDE